MNTVYLIAWVHLLTGQNLLVAAPMADATTCQTAVDMGVAADAGEGGLSLVICGQRNRIALSVSLAQCTLMAVNSTGTEQYTCKVGPT